jgi:hypothetical protein
MRFRRLILTEPVPETIPDPPASHRVAVQAPERTIGVLSSDGVTVYPVTVMPDGRCVCRCRGYGYRQACRHSAEAREILEAESVARSENAGVEAGPR